MKSAENSARNDPADRRPDKMAAIPCRAGEIPAVNQMAAPMTKASSPPRRWWRSAVALLAGFFLVVVLSLGSDAVLRTLGVFPR
jgi:hypothetical protein